MKYLVYVFSLITILAFTKAVSTNTKNVSKNGFSIQDTILPIKKDTLNNEVASKDSLILPNDTVKVEPKKYFGIASFYSASLEGTPTSTQERFTHKKFTCASNRFKLNTWLRVTNLSNGKSIIVRVNDRMHKRMDAKGRIVDLSLIGAKALGFTAKGLTKVQVEVVTKGTKK